MPAQTKTLRTCKNGHTYFKSSACPICPKCEDERKPEDSLMSSLAGPAQRALENKGITTVEQLSNFTQKEILQLHGIGQNSLPKPNKALEARELTFRNNK